VSDAEFNAIFERIKKAGLSYGSAPWSLDDGELNEWNGGLPRAGAGRRHISGQG